MVEEEAKLDPKLLDLSTIVYVYLGNKKTESTGILRLLEVLLSPTRNVKEKLFILEHEFGIPMTRKIESEVSDVCDLSEVIWENGIKTARLDDIKSLMKTLGLSLDQALNALEVPNDEKEAYVEKLTAA